MFRSIASHFCAAPQPTTGSTASKPAPSRPTRAQPSCLTACLPSRRSLPPGEAPPRSTSLFTDLPENIHQQITTRLSLQDNASVAMTHHALYHDSAYTARAEAHRLAQLPSGYEALSRIFARAAQLPADIRSEVHTALAQQAASSTKTSIPLDTLSFILRALATAPAPQDARLLAATSQLLRHMPQRQVPRVFDRLLQYARQADTAGRSAVLAALAQQIRHTDDFVRGEDINDYYFMSEPLPAPEVLQDKPNLRLDKFNKLLAAVVELPEEHRHAAVAALRAAVRHLPPPQRDAAAAALVQFS